MKNHVKIWAFRLLHAWPSHSTILLILSIHRFVIAEQDIITLRTIIASKIEVRHDVSPKNIFINETFEQKRNENVRHSNKGFEINHFIMSLLSIAFDVEVSEEYTDLLIFFTIPFVMTVSVS